MSPTCARKVIAALAAQRVSLITETNRFALINSQNSSGLAAATSGSRAWTRLTTKRCFTESARQATLRASTRLPSSPPCLVPCLSSGAGNGSAHPASARLTVPHRQTRLKLCQILCAANLAWLSASQRRELCPRFRYAARREDCADRLRRVGPRRNKARSGPPDALSRQLKMMGFAGAILDESPKDIRG